uniref:Uncharacterized protein n=1 Tax=Cannabis sativa TaxID=3483 RepID=A0A803QY57_CANSA
MVSFQIWVLFSRIFTSEVSSQVKVRMLWWRLGISRAPRFDLLQFCSKLLQFLGVSPMRLNRSIRLFVSPAFEWI